MTKTIIILVIAAALVAGTLTTATIVTAQEDTIIACVNNKSQGKDFRIVDSADDCRNNETPLEWNKQGPQGDDGPPGATGATGMTGMTGMDGDDGAPGATGATGPAGNDGVGTQGSQGATGPAGADGVGAQGSLGATGPAGANGMDGAPGATGMTGMTGMDGADGADEAPIIGMWATRTVTVVNICRQVPWDIEILNTSPTALQSVITDCTNRYIEIVEPGIYQVSANIYMRASQGQGSWDLARHDSSGNFIVQLCDVFWRESTAGFALQPENEFNCTIARDFDANDRLVVKLGNGQRIIGDATGDKSSILVHKIG